MADPLDLSVIIAMNGYGTAIFEAYWDGVVQLTTAEPDLDISRQLFLEDGRITEYFEEVWGNAAIDLGKENIDASVIMIRDGRATVEFDAYWNDLIT